MKNKSLVGYRLKKSVEANIPDTGVIVEEKQSSSGGSMITVLWSDGTSYVYDRCKQLPSIMFNYNLSHPVYNDNSIKGMLQVISDKLTDLSDNQIAAMYQAMIDNYDY